MGCCQSEMPLEPELPLETSKFAEIHNNSSNGSLLSRPSVSLISFRSSNFVSTVKGSLLQFYDIRTMLGQGAFGKVYSAVSKATGVARAIKSLDKKSLTKQSAERVQREIDILKTLDHPNIVQIVEVIEDQRFINIVQDLCTGGELFDRIVKKGQFSEETAAKMMYQILSAVHHCHCLGIVHRDLKPENILFETAEEDSLLKVIDFGISTRYLHGTPLRKKYGTAYYIAPEILSGPYDEKVDIWSCGVLMYILLSGTPPFSGRNQAEIMARVKSGQYKITGKIWDAVSSKGKDLVTRMLTLDPARRISIEAAFNHPWLKAPGNGASSGIEAELCLQNLNRFRSVDKLKSAALSYIATKLLHSRELNDLKRVFYQLDKDGDGRISRDELVFGYSNTALPLHDIDEIIANCDMDRNGLIDYSEFLTAAVEWNGKLTEDLIETAFRAFDLDSSGTITKAELRFVLETEAGSSEEVWDDLIHEVDINKDGVIDLNEFRRVMSDFLSAEGAAA